MPWGVAMALGFVGALGLVGAIGVFIVMCRSHDEHCRALMRRAGHGFQGTGGPAPQEGPRPDQLRHTSGTVTGEPPRMMDGPTSYLVIPKGWSADDLEVVRQLARVEINAARQADTKGTRDDCAHTLSGCTSQDQAYRQAMADIKRTREGER